MDSSILFEVGKYLHSSSQILNIENSPNADEIYKYRKKLLIDYLDRKLANRPKIEEMYNRNILKREITTFFPIHQLLNKINFSSRNMEYYISPSIANRARKLDFELRRKFIIFKLGIRELEMLNRKK